ncbi:barstar family protein [Dyadobacter diqingensis]|uniref:barstar family protein n=1 Tax=Dyadobacter diqingensis TaxID=2938121 RepID=UPI0020C4B47B|nr:ribonuclease inhibitor [Dyadobacter diqingensis]
MTKQITIDGNSIVDIPSFYVEINRVFMKSETWQIGDSLDALHDLLFGGYGEIGTSVPIELIWINLDKSRLALGYEVTKAYYKQKLEPDSPYNKALFSVKLAALEAGNGDTYFDIILAIIADHPNISLISK